MKCVPKVSHKATFMLDNRGVNDIIQERKKTMCHSWEELSFAPWVTHGVRKMPKSMHNTRPYIENYVICLKRIFLYTIPMNLIYISSGVTRGTSCSYFTSNIKIPIYTGKIPLYREKKYVLCLRCKSLYIQHGIGYESHLHLLRGHQRYPVITSHLT